MNVRCYKVPKALKCHPTDRIMTLKGVKNPRKEQI